MLRLLSDDNFNGRIVRGLRRRTSELDLVRTQDVGLAGTDDPTILAWAADAGRVLLTHDFKTIPRYANQRVMAGEPMVGVVMVDAYLPIGQAIDDIWLLALAGEEDDLDGQVIYLPL